MRYFVSLAVLSFLVLAATTASAIEINATTNLIDQTWPVPNAAKSGQAGATQFASAIDDLPLMDGLSSEPDGDLFFGTADEQLKQSRAVGAVDIDDVYRFYAQTLPQMGWTKITPRQYSRGQQLLRIDAKAYDKTTHVLFTVTPIEP